MMGIGGGSGNPLMGNAPPPGNWGRHQGQPPPSSPSHAQPPPGFAALSFADGGTLPPSNPLLVSWLDVRCPAAFINAGNVLDYFSNGYNPFYDRTCNNETLKMQRMPADQLTKFVGIEYTVLIAKEPLFVIRKQKRHNPNQVTPIADYYIISGTVYQAPDLCSVINARLLSAMNSVRLSFEEATSYMRYHPSKGYWWEFKGQSTVKPDEKKEPTEARVTAFQRTRVDALLADLAQKFPPPKAPEESDEKPTLPASVETEHFEARASASVPKSQQIISSANLFAESRSLEPAQKKFKSEPV